MMLVELTAPALAALPVAGLREHLRLGGQSVSSVAFAVGYESPTQFSREYTRKFGAPPREDLRA